MYESSYSTKTAYLYDGRGSVAQTIQTNSSNSFADAIRSNKAYSPFGELLTEKTSGYGYNGEYYDAATGLLNLRARQYAPAVGRFEQRDVLKGEASNGLSLNRYTYTLNDPVNWIDPSGMSWESIQNALTSVGNKVKEAAQKAVAPIVNAVKTAANTVTNAAKQAVNTVKTAVQSTINTVKTVAQSALAQAKQAVNTVKTVAKSAVQSAAKVATNVKSTAATWAETTAQKVANSINSKTSKVIETAQQKVKQTSAKTPTVQNNTFLNIINNTACRSINYSAAHELFLLFEENADLFGTGNEENHVPNKIFGDYLSYCGNNDDFITWEEYLDQRIEEDLNKQVVAFNGQHPTLATR